MIRIYLIAAFIWIAHTIFRYANSQGLLQDSVHLAIFACIMLTGLVGLTKIIKSK